jgi:erythromycin esterase-like protein
MTASRRRWISRWVRRLLGLGAGVVVVLASTTAAHAQARPDPVTGWVRHHAAPLTTVDPAASLGDLAPLRRAAGDAVIVGLGESAHGAAEAITLKHRVLRLLVERMGFRSVAWEEDWTTGLQIDRYIRTGDGDLAALMARMSPQWQSRQVAEVLAWLRDYNVGRTDKVGFVGVEYYLLGALAYNAVDAYVARTAPGRLAEVRRHLRAIRPSTANMFDHIQWYLKVPDKGPYLRHARQVHRLVKGLPHRPGDRAHALALHHARQIVSFYVHYSLAQPPASDSLVYRDAHAAQNLRWWHRYSGDKVAYWGASAHTANAPRLRIAVPPGPEWRYATAGSYLRRWYGRRYLSIGVTFDHGTVSLGPGATATLPPPEPGWFERPFGRVGLDQFALDLRTPAPAPVRRWLEAPIRTRGLPDGGPGSFMAGGTLAQWFDVIVHRQELTPAEPT